MNRPDTLRHWAYLAVEAAIRHCVCSLTFTCWALSSLLVAQIAGGQTTESIPLDGEWQFRRAGVSPRLAKTVTVPSPFESHEGPDFDGIGIYQRTISAVPLQQRRAILRFHGVATQADVFVNGRLLGQHLGGWTPFDIDITQHLSEDVHLEVHVDEKVGHNSQGFLPVFAPHFGGIWQRVELLLVPPTWIDARASFAWAEPATKTWRVQLKIQGDLPENALIGVAARKVGGGVWGAERRFKIVADRDLDKRREALYRDAQIWLDWRPPHVEFWSPQSPVVYELRFRIGDQQESGVVRWLSSGVLRSGFRSLKTDGRRLFLNGRPIIVRGILNWGWAPPRVAPSIDEQWFREELQQAKRHGFNLMKFCLWIPPKRYLEIADEVGMMTWIEYPTWHSQWRMSQLPVLRREFAEFFQYDRSHPSVVLRSLTCETGPSANLNVIRSLYDMCHEMIPGSIVEDDSSWIQWNRVHDFYDDHPYGNNHTWPGTIRRLEDYIAQRDPKPLVLGEAIAADTWYDRQAILDRWGRDLTQQVARPNDSDTDQTGTTGGELRNDEQADKIPFWLPLHFQSNQAWLHQMQSSLPQLEERQLRADSLRYALQMRKYQVEAFRRMSPGSGYVVSVIRDFPFAEMGILDHTGRPKWSETDWAWHTDIGCLLQTVDEQRTFAAETSTTLTVHVQHGGITPDIDDGTLIVKLFSPGAEQPLLEKQVPLEISAGESPTVDLHWEVPPSPTATAYRLTADFKHRNRVVSQNQWELWAVPQRLPLSNVYRQATAKLPMLPEALRHVPVWRGDEPEAKLVVATHWDTPLIDFVSKGGRALVLADGNRGSWLTTDHWFLRGGPVLADHPLTSQIGRDFLLTMQHFDLAGPVMPDVQHLDEFAPVALLWDNHDIATVKTHALLYESRLGDGSFAATTFRLDNAAGVYLTANLMRHLINGPRPERSLSAATVEAMREKMTERKIDLTSLAWRFRPDPDNQGLRENWHRRAGVGTWQRIEVGKAWESQGHPNLDGWAWYEIEIPIPRNWREQQVYFSLDGADDYYEVYVNGTRIGHGGDRQQRLTAFDQRASHVMTEAIQFGAKNRIVVRVEDWQGAGGLFRPVWIGTAAATQRQLLK